ncbi:MAG TPA: hypothetical protein VFP72_20155 [Kineosporiaceae bacterium]|nr:hypothetical protein [Kineosporiaceae bacterium]
METDSLFTTTKIVTDDTSGFWIVLRRLVVVLGVIRAAELGCPPQDPGARP